MNKMVRCKIGAGSRAREPGPDLSVPHPPKDDDLGRGRHYQRSIMARSGQQFVIANSF
jgi:hypothetical protein